MSRKRFITTIYKPATVAGSTGTLFTQSGVDISAYDGQVDFVLAVTTSSTAGATDKIAVIVQHHTGSTHDDAGWANVTGGTFVVNVTGSTQVLSVNSNELNRYVRLWAKATGTFAVGLTVLGQKNP